jgi:hypothetical protein
MNYITTHQKPPLSFPSVSGAICTFDSQYAGLPLKSHIVDIDYNASGWSSANIAHCGNNIMAPFIVGTYELNGITATVTSDNNIHVTGQKTISGSMNLTIPLSANYLVYNGAYCHFRNSLAHANIVLSFRHSGGAYAAPAISPVNRIYQFSGGTKVITSFNIYFAGPVTEELDFTLQPSLEFTNEVTTYEAYNGTTATISFGSTIYGGSYNALTGIATSTKAADGTDILPVNYQCSPVRVETQAGVNNVFANTGDTTLQYIKLG